MERKIVEYRIVERPTTTQLDKSVNLKIKEGRHPLGGIAIALDSNCRSYTQAMVKYEEQNK